MSDIVERGREAWSKVHRASRFEAWKEICLALAIGREQAFRKSGANAPHGTRYAKAFNAWIDENGFATMPFGLRASCLQLAENLESIEQWRNDLPGDIRAAQNHPQVILRRWRKATGRCRPKMASARKPTVVLGKVAKNGRTISFPQDMIRRAAMAMKESRSTDYFILAKLALETAIRTEADLAELMPKAPKPKAAEAAVYIAPQQAAFPNINLPPPVGQVGAGRGDGAGIGDERRLGR